MRGLLRATIAIALEHPVPTFADDPLVPAGGESPSLDRGGSPTPARPNRRRRRRLSGPDTEASPEARQTVATALLATAVVGSVLAIGALQLPVLVLVAAVSFAALAFALHRQAIGARGVVLPAPALICAALAAFTLLQVVPLPLRWIELLAPTAGDIWERCLLPFGEHGPRWASLSLDPGASAVEVLKWTTYAVVFATAAAVSARHGAARGVGIVFAAAVALALVTLGHGVTEATKVYGIYQPSFRAGPWHIAPLLNANNLAGYLNLGALCGLGLMLGERPPVPRWLLGVGVALILGLEVTTASRGGVFALPIGVLALTFLLRRRRGGQPVTRGVAMAMIGAVVASGIVFAILGATASTWADLRDKDLTKLDMVLWAKPLFRDHPFFGVGRGAFESVFPVYRTTPGNLVFTYAENFVVQWIAEWGVPVGLLALGAFAWAFAPRRFGVHQRAVAAGVWCAMLVLLLQNTVDLGLEVPAVCIGLAAALGAVWGDPSLARAHPGWRVLAPSGSGAPRRALPLAAGVCALGVALVALAVGVGTPDLAADREAVREGLKAAFPSDHAAPGAVAAVRRRLHQAMLRHPAESYFPLVGATAAFRARDESPIPWLQRSLERARLNGRAHLLLAEVLDERGTHNQALLELRLAVEDDVNLIDVAARFATHWTRSFDDLLVTVPPGERGAVMLSALGGVLRAMSAGLPARETDAALGRRCDAEAIQRSPHLVAPRARDAEIRIEALAKGSSSAALCADRDRCREQIRADADAIAAVMPDAFQPVGIRARALLADDRAEEAAKLLEKTCERTDDRVPCLQLRVTAAAAVKDSTLLDASSKELLGNACLTPATCADMVTWVAGVRRGRGDNGMALALLARAAREDPGNEARWLRVADAASEAGAHGQAMDALDKVARHRGGADPALKARIDAERTQALGTTINP
jgi:tetratricopeptide (TPR) repeat protein